MLVAPLMAAPPAWPQEAKPRRWQPKRPGWVARYLISPAPLVWGPPTQPARPPVSVAWWPWRPLDSGGTRVVRNHPSLVARDYEHLLAKRQRRFIFLGDADQIAARLTDDVFVGGGIRRRVFYRRPGDATDQRAAERGEGADRSGYGLGAGDASRRPAGEGADRARRANLDAA